MKNYRIYNPVCLFTGNTKETEGILKTEDLSLEGPDEGYIGKRLNQESRKAVPIRGEGEI